MLERLTASKNALVAMFVITAVMMLLIPIPAFLLSFVIALNIAAAAVTLIKALDIERPLEFSVFPTWLLVMTIVRLAISISVTRLVLLHGDAGSVIRAMGHIVVGGNLIVGLVVFLILVVVNFIVVTNGAGRVAEVQARFTLDALPGKQMAIDVDLAQGQIDKVEAQSRRLDLRREADFYGSMDGAAKFVKGDAIASILIVAVNLIGGIALGVVVRHTGITAALHTYSLLTVGDGLAAMVPALMLSVATGVIVTRSGNDSGIGTALIGQFASHARPLLIAAGALTVIGLYPGMPKLPFLGIGVLLAVVGMRVRQQGVINAEKARQEAESAKRTEKPQDTRPSLPQPDLIELALGTAIIPLAIESSALQDRINAMRGTLASTLGIVLPKVRIRDDARLEARTYAIKIRGEEVARGQVMPGYLLAMHPDPDSAGDLPGTDTIDPAFNLPAKFIPESVREQAIRMNYSVIEPIPQICTHLAEVAKAHAADLLSRDDVKDLLDALKERYPTVVSELIPDKLSIGEVQRVLQALLKEGVSIRDLLTICETLADCARAGTKDIGTMTEQVRTRLGRAILTPYVHDGHLQVIAVAVELEGELKNYYVQQPNGTQWLTLPPQMVQSLLIAARDSIQSAQVGHPSLVVLCSGWLRPHLRDLLVQVAPHVPVIAYSEVPRDLTLEPVGTIAIVTVAAEAA